MFLGRKGYFDIYILYILEFDRHGTDMSVENAICAVVREWPEDAVSSLFIVLLHAGLDDEGTGFYFSLSNSFSSQCAFFFWRKRRHENILSRENDDGQNSRERHAYKFNCTHLKFQKLESSHTDQIQTHPVGRYGLISLAEVAHEIFMNHSQCMAWNYRERRMLFLRFPCGNCLIFRTLSAFLRHICKSCTSCLAAGSRTGFIWSGSTDSRQ